MPGIHKNFFPEIVILWFVALIIWLALYLAFTVFWKRFTENKTPLRKILISRRSLLFIFLCIFILSFAAILETMNVYGFININWNSGFFRSMNLICGISSIMIATYHAAVARLLAPRAIRKYGLEHPRSQKINKLKDLIVRAHTIPMLYGLGLLFLIQGLV